jgi:hypothetical protein
MGRNNPGWPRTLSLFCIAEVALVLMRISVEDASTMSTYVDTSELFGIAGWWAPSFMRVQVRAFGVLRSGVQIQVAPSAEMATVPRPRDGRDRRA